MSLSQAKVFLFRNGDRLVKRLQLQTEQVGLDGTVNKTLDEHRDQRVFICRVCRYTTRKEKSVLGVSVHITLSLLEYLRTHVEL